MKRLYYFIAMAMVFYSCSIKGQHYKPEADKPWNVSIYLDLSDRLKKGKEESQSLRDSALISEVIQLFIDNVVNHKIVPCNDKFQIFFYPTDGIPNASAVSKALSVDLEQYTKTPAEKKKVLLSMKQDILDNVIPIYTATIQNQQWVGSDIWGFFKNKIKISCVREGYRNILVILTDGYIYHKNSKINKDNQYSYILPSNITKPNVKLLSCNNDLGELEVLFIEINPSQFSHFEKIQNLLGTWLTEMGVQHYEVLETDVTANVTPAIKNFFK